MYVQHHSFPRYETTEIEIYNCDKVTFEENSVDDMRSLRYIHLEGIKSLTLNSRSMNWYGIKDRGTNLEERFDVSVPTLKVTIRNSYITTIASHTFAGRISEILLEHVTVERIFPMAFANLLQSERIAIRNSEIRNIDIQAFKKFGTENLELDGVMINQLPSRAFSSISVYENFTINNCSFDVIRPSGFLIDNPRLFQVLHTNVSHLNGEAYKISSRGTVIFRNNSFGEVHDGAFDGIKLSQHEHLSDVNFIFDSNTFYTLSRYSLRISDFDVKYRNIYINESCDCTSLDHKIKESEFFGDIMCLYDNIYVTVKEYKANMCSVIGSYYIWITVICIVIVLVAVVASALVLYYKFVYRSKKYGSKNNAEKGAMSLIVPDGRTYRETELHIIVEKTDLLTTDL